MENLQRFLDEIQNKGLFERQYLSIIGQEVDAVADVLSASEIYQKHRVFERLCIPERVIEFKVQWLNDENLPEINYGWRVQHSNLVGPYKGGLRFHPSVDKAILMSLAFEQSFKNALTGLPIGGAKGGADFDPRGRSDAEIMRFCQAFMSELYRYIGPNRDIPAGDINVGSREIGYMFGQYKKICNQFEGAVTGKGDYFGGSAGRVEATGFGLIYFLQHLLLHHNDSLQGKTICVSGAGNVALHAALKVAQEGGKVISLSNSKGMLHVKNGLSEEQIKWLLKNKTSKDNVLSNASEEFDAVFEKNSKPWGLKCDIALPCATQNEMDEGDVAKLAKSGCEVVAEGSNMALTDEALKSIKQQDIIFAPGKAANAGGVAISTLEMTQNATFSPMSFDDVDKELRTLMESIFHRVLDNAPEKNGKPDLHHGASIAGFKILAEAMLSQGT